MNESTSFQAAREDLAKGLKAVLSAHESKIATLRARELKKSAGDKRLSKSDLCLLCSNAPNACTCLAKAEKQPFSKCKSCSGIMGKHVAKCDLSEVKPGEDVAKAGLQYDRIPPGRGSSTEIAEPKDMGKDPGRSERNAKVVAAMKDKKDVKKADDARIFEKEPKKEDVLPKGAYPKNATARPGAGGACSECGKVGHSPSEHKTKKGEMPIVKPAAEKAVSGAKLPGMPKKADLGDGSGDATKLRKDTSGAMIKKPGTVTLPGMAKPAGAAAPVVGVPGKQPVGQGGGDAFKIPQAAPATSVAQANKELGGAKSVFSNPLAMPGGGAKVAGAPARPPAPVGNNLKPVAGSFMTRKDELSVAAHHEADKRAGGVGWLNSLHASLTAPKPVTPPNDVMLVRDKMNLAKPTGAPAPQPAGPGPSRPSPRAGITGAAALARGEKSAAKTEVSAPTEGLSSINHNRRLLGIRR